MSVKYSGVDWLTMTTSLDGIGGAWYQQYCQHRDEQAGGDVFERQFNNGFYDGLKTGDWQWGYSDRLGYILIISGSGAEEALRHHRPVRHRVTRMDICIDFKPDDGRNFASRKYATALETNGDKRRKYALFHNSDGGETLYVGSRQSMQFGRLYDKGAESGRAAPGELWRAEIEYKKPVSGEIAKALWELQTARRCETITASILGWFAHRYVDLEETANGGELLAINIEKRVTTPSKKLAWLRSQVAPTVSQLVSAGLGKEVLNNLLLDQRALETIWREDT